MDNHTINQESIVREVEKSNVITIRQRIDVLLQMKGLKWADIYNHESLRWHKSFASKVHNGVLIPPRWQRVALARVMQVDTSDIWIAPEIISADKLLEKENE